jgi:dihydroorotate dehydrogenase electron transfer subunit
VSLGTAGSAVPRRIDAPVLRNAAEGVSHRRLVLGAPADWPAPAPGQFVMLHLGDGAARRFDPLLPRPMAVFRAVPRGASRELEVLYKVVGRGTALLAGLCEGARLGVVGPLGRGFPDPGRGQRGVLVGGGTGIASLYLLAARLGPRACVLLGARRAEEIMGLADFEALRVELRIATEDGSSGVRGLVTDLLPAALAQVPAAQVHACGPTPMLQRVAAIAAEAGADCWLSLENRMACGFGVCLGCAVRRRGEGFLLVCRDGPVLAARELAVEALP